MGRLHHLQETLPVNIRNASTYPNIEFVILNYGSKDDLHSWAKKNLKIWIDKGIVKYLRTQSPKYFVATHAKNIAHKQATGDILCNLDADNFIMEGFVEFLIENLNKQDCVVASPSTDMFGITGSCGKIAVKKHHFYSVNGYDESWNLGWGWDDVNFRYRVSMQNSLKYVEVESKWCRVIEHSNEERSKNFKDTDIIKTRDLSIRHLESIAYRQDYIANKNIEWGHASDLSINFDK